MSWRVASLVASVLLLLGVTAATAAAAPAPAIPADIRGVVPHRGLQSPQYTTGNLTYHNGNTMHTSVTYAIYWFPPGSTYSANYQALINGYFQNVATASGRTDNVYATDTQYFDTVTGSTRYILYSSTVGGTFLDSAAFPANGCTDPTGLTICLTDAQLQAEIARVIAAQNWPADVTRQFFLFTPKGVASCTDAAGTTCASNSFCAYHSDFRLSGGGEVVYADEPYAVSFAGCTSGQSPNGDDADQTINMVSHEHNAAITDPDGGGWFYVDGQHENGDECNFTFGAALGSTASGEFNQIIGTGKYWLQEEWSNANAGCVQTYGTAPTCQLSGGTLGANLELTTACAAYSFSSSVIVPSGVTLTVDSGVTVRFAGGQSLTVQQGGALIADASASPTTPIRFTTLSTNPLPGQWGYVALNPGSAGTLKYVTVQYGGGGSYSLYVASSAVLDHVRVDHSGSTGLDVEAGTPSISSSTVSNSVGDGVHLGYGCPSLSNTTISGNTGYGLSLNLGAPCDPTLSSLTIAGNGNGNWVGLGPSACCTAISSPRTLPNVGEDYVTIGSIAINGGGKLTIMPGVTVHFGPLQALQVQQGGVLVADASASPSTPITFTTAGSSLEPGQWDGIYFMGGSAGTLRYVNVMYAGSHFAGLDIASSPTLDHVNVTSSGSPSGEAVQVDSGATPTITSSSVNNSPGMGMYVDSSCPTVAGTTFQNNAGYGLSLTWTTTCDPALSALTFNGNGNNNWIAVDPGTIASAHSLPRVGADYVVVNTYYDLLVDNGGSLTIGAGVKLHFGAGLGLRVASGGTLVADGSGSPSTPITFTTASSTPTPGQWYGVYFAAGSAGALKYVTIKDAGFSQYWGSTGLYVASSPTLDHVTVDRTGGSSPSYGIDLEGSAAPIITNSVISNGAGTGIYLNGGCPTIQGTSITNNSGYGLSLNLALACDPTLTNLSISGNGYNNWIGLVGNPIGGVRTLPYLGADYVATNSLTVPNGGRLMIQPGDTLHFGANQELIVGPGGTLIADASGNPAAPITFTTAAAIPSPGQWDGVYFNAGSNGTLKYVTFAYAGGHALYLQAAPTLGYLTFLHNVGTGLDIEATITVSVRASNFEDAPDGSGIANNGGTVDASASWWGSATGPTISSNVGGTGDAITGSTASNVNYSGFTCAPTTGAAEAACTSVVGGSNLQLTVTPTYNVGLAWTGGTVQTGYDVLRVSSAGTTVLPASGPLPFSATSYTDSSSLTNPYYCYTVVPLYGLNGIGYSDLLCYFPGLHAGSVPGDFGIALDQGSTASLSWTSPGGQTAYALVAIPMDGSGNRVIALPGTATSYADATAGKFTCYVLVALDGPTAIGNSDAVCGDPGFSTLAPAAAKPALTASRTATPRLTLDQVKAQVQSAGDRALHGRGLTLVEQAVRSLRRAKGPHSGSAISPPEVGASRNGPSVGALSPTGGGEVR